MKVFFFYIAREPLPSHWDADCDSFQKMLVLKCIRVDKLTNAMQDFVALKLGQRFIEPQTADLSLAFKDSSPTSPLIFILSQVKTCNYLILHLYDHICSCVTTLFGD